MPYHVIFFTFENSICEANIIAGTWHKMSPNLPGQGTAYENRRAALSQAGIVYKVWADATGSMAVSDPNGAFGVRVGVGA